jgi:hypothetical protein
MASTTHAQPIPTARNGLAAGVSAASHHAHQRPPWSSRRIQELPGAPTGGSPELGTSPILVPFLRQGAPVRLEQGGGVAGCG